MSGWFLLASVHALLGSMVLAGVAFIAVGRAWNYRGSGVKSVTNDMRRWLAFAWLWYAMATVHALVGVLVTTRWH